MKATIPNIALACVQAAMLLAGTNAHAQLGDILKSEEAGGASGGAGSLGGLGSAMSGSSITSGSAGNVAGVLEYCIKNNYVGGDASSIKDKLMGKLPGGQQKPDEGYKDGAKGLLKSGDGKSVSLGGMKSDLTRKVCDQVLAQGKSLL